MCLCQNKRGQTPGDVSVVCDRFEVLNALLLACCGHTTKAALASVTALVAAGAVPDTWAPNGSSALMLAAGCNAVETLAVRQGVAPVEVRVAPRVVGVGPVVVKVASDQ
jgi:hypothetical protein